MQSVLFIISALTPSAAARQLTLLARHLSTGRAEPGSAPHSPSCAVRVCILGPRTSWVDQLQQAGIEVECLGWTRPLDLRPFVGLRAQVQKFRPTVIHTWGLGASRALAVSGGRGNARLVVSLALPVDRQPNLVERWLLRRADAILAFGERQAKRYQELDLGTVHITTVAPAVDPALFDDQGKSADLPGIEPEHPVLLGLGPLNRHKGFREAVWALDLLNNLHPNTHLVLVGEGSDRDRVDRFARSFGTWRRVHFVGSVDTVQPYLQRANIVLVPSFPQRVSTSTINRSGGGLCALAEGLAAQRPVIASNCPDLAEWIVEGETGYLVPPGDAVALARRMRGLLDNPEQMVHMGQSARQYAEQHFRVEHLVQRTLEVYSQG